MAPIHVHPRGESQQPRGLQPRIRLALLAALARRRRQSDGTVMGIVMLVVLGVTLAAVAIANQIGSGAIRAPLMGQSREAREAAEAGVMEVINELNKFENRRLLIADNPLDWRANQTNACLATPRGQQVAAGLGLGAGGPSVRALALGNGAEIPIGGGNARRYVLRRVQVLNPNRTNSVWAETGGARGVTGNYDPDVVNLFDEDPFDKDSIVGYVRVTVEGRFYQPGAVNPTSIATVTREFQVAPKCCFSSFGPAWARVGGQQQRQENIFGPDQRACVDQGNNIGAGLGMVAFGGNNTSSGGAMSIQVDTNVPPDDNGNVDIGAVVCVGQCTGTKAFDEGAIPVEERILDIRPVPPAPVFPGSGNSIGADTLPATVNPTTGVVTENPNCRLFDTNEVYITAPNPAPNPNTERAWQCVVNNINLTGNKALNIDTGVAGTLNGVAVTPAPVRLWVRGDISLGGTSGIRHLRAGANVTAFPNGYDDLHIYGRNDGTPQDWQLRGNTQALAAFIYAPSATCTMRGGGGVNNFTGQIWCAGFDLRGNITITVPPADAGGAGGGGGIGVPPAIFDYVARSTWGSRLFGNN